VRGAFEAGVHDFVAQHSVADIDRAGRRSRDANDLILDDDRFADARLRMSGICCKPCGRAKGGDSKNAVTPIHFNTDRFIPSSYGLARANGVVNLPQTAHDTPDG
jgi:hypothetical protein